MQISASFPSPLRNSTGEASHSDSNLSRRARCGFGGSVATMNMHEAVSASLPSRPGFKVLTRPEPAATLALARQAVSLPDPLVLVTVA